MIRPKVNEFSSKLKQTNRKLNISVKNIAKCVRIAMGEFTGIANLFNNLDNSIELVCSNSDNINHYSKLELGEDGKSLLGVMLIGKTNTEDKKCLFGNYSTYKTELHIKLFSITAQDEEQLIKIQNNFSKRFNTIVNKLNEDFDSYDNNSTVLENKFLTCCKKIKNYKSDSEIDYGENIEEAYDIFDTTKNKNTTFIPHNNTEDIELQRVNSITKAKDKKLVKKMLKNSNINSYNMKLFD